MVEAATFRAIVAEHRVIGVTGEAGMIARNKAVLEMRGRQVAFVIDVQALAEIGHDMARKAELRRCGAVQMFAHASPTGEDREHTKCKESQDRAAPATCESCAQSKSKR